MDEKKIEEAAYTETEGMYGEEESLANGFIAGARWAIAEFLKGLWHDTSEKPILKEGKCLVVCNDGRIEMFKIAYIYEMLSNFGAESMCWKRWCYLDDLTEKGGEK